MKTYSEGRDILVTARDEADKALQAYDLNVLMHKDITELPAQTIVSIIRACEVELMERDDAWREFDAENREG